VWDEDSHQFAHASGIVVVTPQGKVSRYFFGVDYAPRDVKFALVESSTEKIGSLADRLLLYCYHYDPAKGNYGFVAMRAVRIGGAVTMLALIGFVFVSLRKETTGQ
jgi:protein SCO1/2